MKLLAIETATDACSCALRIDGDCLSRYQLAPRQHAELALSMVDALLTEAGVRLRDLDGLAYGRGPGSFTGVRIAVGVAQGLAFGATLPVVGVSSLQALAQRTRREHGERHVLSAFDARMSEVYWAAYVEDQGIMSPVTDEGVFAPDRVPIPKVFGEWFGVGDGWGAHEETLGRRVDVKGSCASIYPHATDVATLGVVGFERGEAGPAEQALPVYLRDMVTREPGSVI